MQLGPNIENNVENEKNNCEIIQNEDGVILEYTDSGNKHSIKITIDDNFERQFSHSTEGIISNGDLFLQEENINKKLGDEDKLKIILEKYNIIIEADKFIETSLYMDAILKQKITKKTKEELENLEDKI
ncbi:MAG TPA: hypothetical protein P5060_01920 [Candidatus Absconditabacterales bacterium]|nr:hypothetical protein [Candidatus Absconditabacterales bacterium]